jgi:dihydrofolate reductase
LVREIAKTKNVYVIGGAMLYKSMLSYYDEVLVTKVDADGEAEVFFPNLDENHDFEGKPIGSSTQDGDHTIRFWVYNRK